MPLGTIFEHHEEHDALSFYMVAISLRNARLVFITDHETRLPALGNPAIGTPTRVASAPVVASALPFTNHKYEILAKSIAEILARKLNAPVFLFLDVHFESMDVNATRTLKLAAGRFCDEMVPSN